MPSVLFGCLTFLCGILMLSVIVITLTAEFSYLSRFLNFMVRVRHGDQHPSVLAAHHLDEFVRKWSFYDPRTTGRIHHKDLYEILHSILPPLGFGRYCPHRQAYRRLIRMNMPLADNGTVQFNHALFALIREALTFANGRVWDSDLPSTIHRLYPRMKTRKMLIRYLLVQPDGMSAHKRLTVGKFYAGLLLWENWGRQREVRQRPRLDRSILGAHHLDAFVRNWALYDPDFTGQTHYKNLDKIYRNMVPPLGIGRFCFPRLAYHKVIRQNIPLADDETVHFTHTLFACVREAIPGDKRWVGFWDDEFKQYQHENQVISQMLRQLWPSMREKATFCQYFFVPADGVREDKDLTVGKIYTGLLMLEKWRSYQKVIHAHRQDPAILSAHHVDAFMRSWLAYDPTATGRISHTDMFQLLHKLPPPVGLGLKCPRDLAHRRLIRMNIPVADDGTVRFACILYSAIRSSLTERGIKFVEHKENNMNWCVCRDEIRRVIKLMLIPKVWDIMQVKHMFSHLVTADHFRVLQTDKKLTIRKLYAALLLLDIWRKYKRRRLTLGYIKESGGRDAKKQTENLGPGVFRTS